MPNEDKIEKVSKVERKGSKEIDEIDYQDDQLKNIEVNKDHFDSLMMQERKQPLVKGVEGVSNGVKKPSLMDEVSNFNQKVDTATKSSAKNIAVQAADLVSQLDELKTKLATPDLQLKTSVQNLLHSKLSHIDESLKIALNKAGVEYVAPAAQKNLATPIERFLGFITDAQSSLNGLGNEVEKMALNKGTLSPADMLAIQVKVGYVQNEIDFFTGLLNQALSATKTIMNIQV